MVIVSKRKWLGLGLAGVVLAGTACQQSRVAEHWGEAQRDNVARMAQNPEAEFAPASEIEGLDPLSAEAVVGKYGLEQAEVKEHGQMPSIIEISGPR